MGFSRGCHTAVGLPANAHFHTVWMDRTPVQDTGLVIHTQWSPPTAESTGPSGL